jgi:hypothetical protein
MSNDTVTPTEAAVAALARAITEAGMPDWVGIWAEAKAIIAALPEGWHLTHSDAAEVERVFDAIRKVGVSETFVAGDGHLSVQMLSVDEIIDKARAALSSTEAVSNRRAG